MPYSIVIVDDYELYCDGLTRIINQEIPDFEVLYSVEHGRALVERFKDPRNVPDIVLTDVNMPVMDGFETAEWLKNNYPTIYTIAITVDEDEKSILKMVRNGARGYLLKKIKLPELRQALHYMIEKGYYHSDWLSQTMFRSIAGGETEKQNAVNDRELKFLKLAASDLTYEEIGDKMNLSPRTAEKYREVLCDRFNCKTRLMLVLTALKEKIIRLDEM